MLELSNMCHCVQHLFKLTSRDYWSSRNERNPLLQQKCVFRKFCGISQKWWMLELSNLCHCVQHPENLLVEITGALGWRNPLSKQKCILRKCCGVSQKQWMLELSNLCHCVQHPWKLTGMDFWSSRNEWKPLSKLKHVLEKMLWSISEMVNARAFKPLPLCSAPLKTYWYEISGALGINESHFLSYNMFWENAVEYLRNSEC